MTFSPRNCVDLKLIIHYFTKSYIKNASRIFFLQKSVGSGDPPPPSPTATSAPEYVYYVVITMSFISSKDAKLNIIKIMRTNLYGDQGGGRFLSMQI